MTLCLIATPESEAELSLLPPATHVAGTGVSPPNQRQSPYSAFKAASVATPAVSVRSIRGPKRSPV